MKGWEVEEIRRAVKGRWQYRASGGAVFNGRVGIDSRQIGAGEMFVAIKGERHDAHDFVGEVIEKKAAVVMVHRELPAEALRGAQARDVHVLLVENTVAALNRLAAAYRASGSAGGMRAKVIAVGGSNGKTTTKFIIHALLSRKFHGLASPKSFNNNIGMPLTLLEVEAGHDFVVLEIGTNHPGEIDALGAVCRPDIAVITSIGLEHLEFFHNIDGVAREEAAIAPHVAENGTLVLPAEAGHLLHLLKSTDRQKILVGRKEAGGGTDLVLTELRQTVGGLAFSINGRGNFVLPLFGEHNAMNALMAVAVARRLGLSEEQIAEGLGDVRPAEMRFAPVPAAVAGRFFIINDAYNANPSSMEVSLRTFVELCAACRAEGGEGRGGQAERGAAGRALAGRVGSNSRKIAILGDMRELGAAAPELHRGVGRLVADLHFDLFIAIGPLMAHAADVAAESGVAVHRFPTTASAGLVLRELLEPGDQILLKGSHSMALETLLKSLTQPVVVTADH